MDVRHERRGAIDRREFAPNYRGGVERRVNPEQRRGKLAGDELSDDEMVTANGYWGDAEDDSSRE